MDKISNLEFTTFALKEKLCLEEDKNSSLSVFYSKRLNDFSNQIETYKNKNQSI